MSGMRKAPPISISSPREIDALRGGGQRVEHQQHRGGVVVDDGRRFGAGQLAQQVLDELVALAALARVQVEFEIDRRGQRLHTARTASSGSSARPRLVCSTVPVRLNTGRSRGREACVQLRFPARRDRFLRPTQRAAMCPPRAALRSSSQIRAQASAVTCVRPCRASSGASPGRSAGDRGTESPPRSHADFSEPLPAAGRDSEPTDAILSVRSAWHRHSQMPQQRIAAARDDSRPRSAADRAPGWRDRPPPAPHRASFSWYRILR